MNTYLLCNFNSTAWWNIYNIAVKVWIIYFDFNGDGLPDISYIDPHNYWNNSLSRKSVFIRTGNQYVEDDFYKYDPYANSIKPK